MASREELLDSIQPGMKLTKSLLKRIYGYELTWPGFAEIALLELEISGGMGDKARYYYDKLTAEWKQEYEVTMNNAAKWYAKQDFSKKVVRRESVDRRKSRYQFAGFPEDW